MFMDGGNERFRDQVTEHQAELEAEREEEILWLADLLPSRTNVARSTVLRVLEARDRALAEADAE